MVTKQTMRKIYGRIDNMVLRCCVFTDMAICRGCSKRKQVNHYERCRSCQQKLQDSGKVK